MNNNQQLIEILRNTYFTYLAATGRSLGALAGEIGELLLIDYLGGTGISDNDLHEGRGFYAENWGNINLKIRTIDENDPRLADLRLSKVKIDPRNKTFDYLFVVLLDSRLHASQVYYVDYDSFVTNINYEKQIKLGDVVRISNRFDTSR